VRVRCVSGDTPKHKKKGFYLRQHEIHKKLVHILDPIVLPSQRPVSKVKLEQLPEEFLYQVPAKHY
jgi:hypothetical protein